VKGEGSEKPKKSPRRSGPLQEGAKKGPASGTTRKKAASPILIRVKKTAFGQISIKIGSV
jgi:hypothetical protein